MNKLFLSTITVICVTSIFAPELLYAASGMDLPTKVDVSKLGGVSETFSVIDIIFFTWARFVIGGILFGVSLFSMSRNFLGAVISFIAATGIMFLPKIISSFKSIGGESGIF